MLIYNYLNFKVVMGINDISWTVATEMWYENICDFVGDKITSTANSAVDCFQALDWKETLNIIKKIKAFSIQVQRPSWFLSQDDLRIWGPLVKDPSVEILKTKNDWDELTTCYKLLSQLISSFFSRDFGKWPWLDRWPFMGCFQILYV